MCGSLLELRRPSATRLQASVASKVVEMAPVEPTAERMLVLLSSKTASTRVVAVITTETLLSVQA